MCVYRHNNVCMSIDMVIENSELKSALTVVHDEHEGLLTVGHAEPMRDLRLVLG